MEFVNNGRFMRLLSFIGHPHLSHFYKFSNDVIDGNSQSGRMTTSLSDEKIQWENEALEWAD